MHIPSLSIKYNLLFFVLVLILRSPIISQPFQKTKDQYDSLAKKISLPQNIYLSIPNNSSTNRFEKPINNPKFKLHKRNKNCFPNDHSGKLFNAFSEEIYDEDSPNKSQFALFANYVVRFIPKMFLPMDSIEFLKSKLDRFAGYEDYFKEQRRGLLIIDSIVYVPLLWTKKIDAKNMKSIWIQCQAKINSEGDPVKKVNMVQPIFLETINGNYSISVKKLFKFNLGGSLSGEDGFFTQFSKNVLEGCRENENLVHQFLQKIQTKLLSKLQAYPYSASQFIDFTVPDNELWLTRKDKASNLLDAYYTENIKYFLKWNFIKNDGKIVGLKVFLQQDLMIETGKGNGYREPTQSQIEKYRDPLNKLMAATISEVCAELKLKFNIDNICKCN